MAKHLKILTAKYLEEYSNEVTIDWQDVFNRLRGRDKFTAEDFKHMIMVSATYSSNIEGNTITPDDYLKIKTFGVKSKPKETAEIDDLVNAYNYAKENKLTASSFLNSHKILSKNLLKKEHERGRFRTGIMGVVSSERVHYVAIESQFIKKEMDKLFFDVKELMSRDLSYKEMFYYASMIHLRFEKIHPFTDGNGRAGRLLEKWFLVEKIGQNAWSIKSEKYYSIRKQDYYKNINIGIDYYATNMDLCLPFLLMLPRSLR